MAHAVGVGAVKFYDLKTDRDNGYDFDLEAMVSFEGETGPYVQYAYARIQSILRKANFVPSAENDYKLADAESWDIIKHIQNFSNVVERAGDKFDPSLIAKYAINLAQAFNKYYAHTRILDESPERDSRLALAYATGLVLKEALRLLGVKAPEKCNQSPRPSAEAFSTTLPTLVSDSLSQQLLIPNKNQKIHFNYEYIDGRYT